MGAECTFVVVVGQGTDDIAKLVDVTGNIGVIQYFDSPSGPRFETSRVPMKELRQIELATQTRVFRLNPLSGSWSVGRVDGGIVSGKALGKLEDHYHVRFPNGRDERVAISQLFVRRSSPVEDPTEYLASMITDTPFFFDGRSRIVRHLADQRRLFGGLTGLASSAIELLEHQVSVVRKVLSDPIQRYLLADEVGLGKTIEAGILIRQHLLDHPDDADVLVVVPDHLVLQWRKELRTKFYIYVEDERVRVIPLSTMQATEMSAAELSLLVIDEAHVSAEWAFSTNPRLSAGFLRIRDLAKLSQRVLLLSGTPVLYREKEFLAMLHLLDPEGYRLSEIDSFRKRISERQTVAEALVDLSDDANGMFVEEALDRIDVAFANEARTAQLSAGVRAKLWDDVGDSARVKVLRDLRNHIRETHKLDRRILRTRRVDQSLRDRLPDRTGAAVVDCPDPARAESEAFLEAWRLSIDDLIQPSDSSKAQFAEFVSAAIVHPRHLARRIQHRIAALEGVHQSAAEGVGLRTPAFVGEREFLEDWNVRLSFRLDDGDGRTMGLIEWLKRSAARRKYVLFVTDREIADIVALTIRNGQTPFEIIRYNGKAADVRAFEQAATPVVLVCDRRAEEGLNLQRAGAIIIHYDLPVDPLRIEQRIGRLDRIEGRGHVSNVVLAAKTAYEMAWIECVTEAVGVFNRSIAPLQFLLNTEVTILTAQLLSQGASAFLETSGRLRDPLIGTLAELKRVDAQEAIDSAEVAAERESGFFQRLVEADERIADIGKKNLDAWLVKRLGFDYQALDEQIGRYVHNVNHTLVPAFDALKYFDESLDRTSHEHRRKNEMPLLASTFHRDVAEMRQVPLLRIGNAMVNALERFVRDDPRGMAFGIWRTVPAYVQDPRAFFRFDFYVQARLDPAVFDSSSAYSLEALRRRADWFFPVQYETVWLDSDMEVVTNSSMLELVGRTFSKYRRPDGSFDSNLSHLRWQETIRKLETSDWAGLCNSLRIVAEERLKESKRYQVLQRSALERFNLQAEQRTNVYDSRMSVLGEEARATEKKLMAVDLELNHFVRVGIADPSIRLDSVGCVVIATEPLEAE